MSLSSWCSVRRFAFERWLLDRRDPDWNFPVVPRLSEVARERAWEVTAGAEGTIQSNPPCKHLQEDVEFWMRGGVKLLEDQRDWHRDPRLTWRWAGWLQGVRRYRASETFACVVPGGAVIERGGGVLTRENELIGDSYHYLWKPRTSEWGARKEHHLEGRVLNLMSAWSESNYSHFTIDVALRLTLFDSLEGVSCLVPSDVRPWHYEVLEMLGVPRERVVPAPGLITRCDELLACRISDECFVPHRVHLVEYRRRMLKAAGMHENVPGIRKLYLSREGDKRGLTNETELWPIFQARGFEKIVPAKLSIRDQVRLFSSAQAVVSMHGSGFINAIFSPPGTVLIELFNPRWWDASSPRYCQLLGHDYWYGFGENDSPGYETRFSSEKLERLLDYALGGDSVDLPPI